MRIKPFVFKAIICLSFVVELVKSDPDPLQDYCVADTKNTKNFFLNGVECINPELAVASNFATSTLAKPGNTKNTFGFNVTATNVAVLPGVNTQGLTLARVDLAPGGLGIGGDDRAEGCTLGGVCGHFKSAIYATIEGRRFFRVPQGFNPFPFQYGHHEAGVGLVGAEQPKPRRPAHFSRHLRLQTTRAG
nr:germin-like protein subfamily 1 member 1 [Ipomoea batatas]